MKIRIRGNSIRLRLSQSEVEEIGKGNEVSEITHFPAGNSFVYGLKVHSGSTTADFANGKINIFINADAAQKWAGSDEVGIEAWPETANGELRLLIEKDFACLTDRVHEDESDAFPNPNSTC